MASRRTPLSNNPNAANSPIRPAHLLLSKNGRTYTRTTDRDPQQQPPAKKQALNDGRQRHLSCRERDGHRDRESNNASTHRSRTSTYEAKLANERSRPIAEKERTSANSAAAGTHQLTAAELDNLRQWKMHHRAKFPRFVFYFEKVPENERHRCAKQLAQLGAREETFFSIEITHVITTRSIPPPEAKDPAQSADTEQEQPQTINPSLLSRESSVQARKGLQDAIRSRSHNAAACLDDKKTKSRNPDVLCRARNMGKKIWSLDKFQRVLYLLLDEDEAEAPTRGRSGTHSVHGMSRTTGEPNLLQLIQNERVNGPADRDPTAASKEMHFFSGPYMYIFDVNEKLKPIMVREYKKVSNKADGDWPQFRSVAGGRCPFVEDLEFSRESRAAEKEHAKKRAKAQEARAASAVTGKRTLSQMENDAEKGKVAAPPQALFDPPKTTTSTRDVRHNAFTSRAMPPRLLAGEPVASGLQQSKMTSAIQSQIVSSTTGTLGAKAGTSREVQGLQRAVLQRQGGGVSQEVTSRSTAEQGAQEGKETISTGSRPANGASNNSRQFLHRIEEAPARETRAKKASRLSRPQVAAKPKKRDPKPGYCENCQDKFADFDEHIDSRKHRRFAENDENWHWLDQLLAQLGRPAKHQSAASLSHRYGDEAC